MIHKELSNYTWELTRSTTPIHTYRFDLLGIGSTTKVRISSVSLYIFATLRWYWYYHRTIFRFPPFSENTDHQVSCDFYDRLVIKLRSTPIWPSPSFIVVLSCYFDLLLSPILPSRVVSDTYNFIFIFSFLGPLKTVVCNINTKIYYSVHTVKRSLSKFYPDLVPSSMVGYRIYLQEFTHSSPITHPNVLTTLIITTVTTIVPTPTFLFDQGLFLRVTKFDSPKVYCLPISLLVTI